MTSLQVLPVRTAGAAENMAGDFLLLQRYPDPGAPRFRHYGWRGSAFTFGYSQKIAWVRSCLPVEEHVELCRRPTGGGVVDHRHDWTYALVLPRGHPLCDGRAAESYRVVHAGLAAALRALGQPAELKKVAAELEPADPDARPGVPVGRTEPVPGICFQRAELYDVVNAATGAKIAGAAQKRNKHGLLFQGSIERSAVGLLDWDEFGERFTAALAQACGGEATPTPWPEFQEEEVAGLVEQYASPEWIDQR